MRLCSSHLLFFFFFFRITHFFYLFLSLNISVSSSTLCMRSLSFASIQQALHCPRVARLGIWRGRNSEWRVNMSCKRQKRFSQGQFAYHLTRWNCNLHHTHSLGNCGNGQTLSERYEWQKWAEKTPNADGSSRKRSHEIENNGKSANMAM